MSSLARFMSRASRQIGIRGEVNVLLTSNADMRRLNRQYRKKNVATDVLSFPAPDVKGVTGDIAISLEIAKQSAKTRSELLEQEVCILILHGLLHLAGFDHDKDNGVMKRKEEQLRRSFGLAAGLIERAQGANRLQTSAKMDSRRNRTLPAKPRAKAQKQP